MCKIEMTSSLPSYFPKRYVMEMPIAKSGVSSSRPIISDGSMYVDLEHRYVNADRRYTGSLDEPNNATPSAWVLD
jgi:hypothetical protein